MSEDKAALEDVVADFLRDNPGFFERHPDVLEAIEIGHVSGGAVSLIERQVEQLRDRNETLSRRLEDLVRIASENERLAARLHALTLELAPVDSLPDFFDRLVHSLQNDFNVDIVRIHLPDGESAAGAGEFVIDADPEDDVYRSFAPMLERGAASCGRFNEAKMEYLFGNRGRWVLSTALIPVGPENARGMVAIGSSDQNRFYPGMGTLFLDLLADVIDAKLSAAAPEEQRRSA